MNPTPYTTLAETYGFMGKTELFYQALEKAIELGFNLEQLLKTEPYTHFLHQKRFQAIIQAFMEKKEAEQAVDLVIG